MRITLILLFIVLSIDICLSQAPGENYIVGRSYRVKSASVDDGNNYWGVPLQVQTQISFMDGLGKVIKSVSSAGNPLQHDLVVTTEYNDLFQPVKQYLPIAVNQATNTPLTADYYNSSKVGNPTTSNFTETIYDGSPLERVKEVKSPGVGTGVKKKYLVNNSATQSVKRYYINASGVLTEPETYPDNTLLVTQTTDENNKKIEEFTDYNGRVVLKRVAETEDTYYVYDGKGLLRYVLQPQFQEGSASLSTKIRNYAFRYTYDGRGRIDSTSIPGKGTSVMEYYDSSNMIRFLKDPKGQKFYYKYDALNRQTEMGLLVNENEQVLLKTQYDNYNGITTEFDNTVYTLTDDDHFIGSPKTDSKKGLVTMISARVLGGEDWLNTVMFYDKKGRLVQKHRDLYDLGDNSKEVVSYRLDFTGNIVEEQTKQTTNSIKYLLDKDLVYDHQNRLRKIEHTLSSVNTINDQVTVLKKYEHVANTYNEIGQLESKFLHKALPATSSASYTQSLNYKYTPRGWLHSIDNEGGKTYQFGLGYDDNGNINNLLWQTPSGGSSFTTITYDGSNRLSETSGPVYKERNITYDKNGNIKTLKREGPATADLSYSYTYMDQSVQQEGNRLTSISNTGANGIGVKNGISNYAYDANGNISSDGNKGAEITYNLLDLPSKVQLSNKVIDYYYDAAGIKLRMSSVGSSTIYAGAFEYDQFGTLLRIGLEEGQLILTNAGAYEVNYYLRDHLGNVRMVLNQDGSVLQETDYYAFGLAIPRSGTDAVNKYTFLGREKQPETGYMDLMKRFYDPTVGRFMQVDPVTANQENYSTYQYGWNNPILRSDPNGDCPPCGDEAGQIGIMIGAAVMNAKNSLMTLAYNAGDALGITPTEKGMKWEAVERQVGDSYVTSMEQVPRQGLLRDVGGHFLDGLNATAVVSPANGSTNGLLTKTVPDAVVATTVAKAGKDAIKGGVYVLKEGETVVRSGRTINLARREAQHASDPVLGNFKFQTIYKTDAYSEQRGLEHLVYRNNPSAAKANGGYNKIGAISEKNPNIAQYLKAAEEYLRNNK